MARAIRRPLLVCATGRCASLLAPLARREAMRCVRGRQVFYLAAASVASTPTANNIMVMIEVAGGDKTAMATAIFSQYAVAPALLTLTLTLNIALFQAYG
jgi:hypothetical protein